MKDEYKILQRNDDSLFTVKITIETFNVFMLFTMIVCHGTARNLARIGRSGKGGWGHTPSPTPTLKPRPIMNKKLKCYKTQQTQEKGVGQGFASPSPFLQR